MKLFELTEIEFKEAIQEKRWREQILSTNEGIPDDFKLMEGTGRSKYNNYMIDLVPSLNGKIGKLCLLCAIEKQKLFYIFSERNK